MKNNDFINDVLQQLSDVLNKDQLDIVSKCLVISLNDYELMEKQTSLVAVNQDNTTKAIQMFFISKKVEGCTDNTLHYYKTVVSSFFNKIPKAVEEIIADDVRYYIAIRSMKDKISKVSQDNELRVLKSFFTWCGSEGYITKIPTLNIKPIKQQKRIKKPFTEIELEKLRQHTECIRDLAIIDTLYSTGVRVSELIGIDKTDIDNEEITVFGKGEKERIVYLNAKAQLSIKQYLETRNDNNPALFVSTKQPFKRLSKGSVERMVKNLGKLADIDNVHPHRFRRTCATSALNRGMPIEQVSQMLGHELIETTTIYARSDKENIKASHKKFVV